MIRINLIKTKLAMTDKVNFSTKAYGPDIGEIKDKTTRSRPTQDASNIVKITDQFLEVMQ